jgi:hypothetical protein
MGERRKRGERWREEKRGGERRGEGREIRSGLPKLVKSPAWISMSAGGIFNSLCFMCVSDIHTILTPLLLLSSPPSIVYYSLLLYYCIITTKYNVYKMYYYLRKRREFVGRYLLLWSDVRQQRVSNEIKCTSLFFFLFTYMG